MIMPSRQNAVNSHSNNPDEKEKGENSNQIEKNIEFLQDQTSVEQTTNPTENTTRNPLQIPESSHPRIFTEQTQNLSL